MGMNYGNANDVTDQCGLCNDLIDRHSRFKLIRSDEYGKGGAEDLVRELQKKLDGAAKSSHVRGLDLLSTMCMSGAAVATINNRVCKYVTISGVNIAVLNQIGSLGTEVTILQVASALPLSSIGGKRIPGVQPPPWNRNRDYPIGGCAAQKLLMAIFNQADRSGGRDKITKISLAEILWVDPGNSGHNRDWSTGSIVCSCDTCKRVVPMMLCDKAE
jgi:hypothetical protein